MSKYLDFECAIVNEAAMRAGFEAMLAMLEISSDNVVISASGENDIPLYGYHGDMRPERVMFAVRRQAIGGSSNDIGFWRGEDGKFRCYLSEFDASQTRAKEIVRAVNTEAQVHHWSEVARQRGAKCEVKRDERGRLTEVKIKPMGGR